MAAFSTQRAREFYAETYDSIVEDWDGEIDFYRKLALEAKAKGHKVLEVACGTGRVTMPLVRESVEIVGLDLSPAMLRIAQAKTVGLDNIRWVNGDMCNFNLGETFGLIFIAGHSFQNILTTENQFSTMKCIHQHLVDGGVLVVHLDHQDFAWLGGLMGAMRGVFEPAGDFTHPRTKQSIHTEQAWWYEPSTQIATSQVVWEAVNPQGKVVERWESGDLQYHCLFRFEMQHLLERSGFDIKALYGDFGYHELKDDSSSMVWVAGRR